LATAATCGAEALAEEVRRDLFARGARPRRAQLQGPEALTGQERRVCELARAGMTNPQIAAELFITLRTVGAHLTNAYRKLGITTRDQLPDLPRGSS
jgi:DNA-binding CsgD family transcriptional regulator